MKNLFSYWQIDLITMIFIVALIAFYFLTIQLKPEKKSVYFFSGIIIFIIAVASPLHFLGMHYLFSAHMVSHILLLLIAGPLMVAGIPAENRFKKSLLFFSKKIYKAPVICWLIGVSIMWFWHIPYMFNKMFAMHDMMRGHHSINFISIIHAVSLLLSGMLFSWPLLNPYPQYRIAPMNGVLYLSIACVFCSLLGLLITFSPVGTYHYNLQMDAYGFSSIIKNQWGISASGDQQMAGLIMWVPCCFIYLIAIMFLFKKWFSEKEVVTKFSLPNNIMQS